MIFIFMRNFLFVLFLFFSNLSFSQRQNLIFESSFEDPNLTEWDGTVECYVDRVTTSTNIKRFGQRSARFTSYLSDTLGCIEVRSQLILNDTNAINYERWYGFSFYLSGNFPTNYDGVENFLEFFRTDTNEFYHPLVLAYHGFAEGVSEAWPSGKYITSVRVLRTEHPASPYTIFINPLAKINNQEWVDVVMRIKWSDDSTGRIRIWFNDNLVYSYNGVTNYGPNNIRIGIDKWDWRLKWGISSTTERELYIDEFRIGNSFATYADVRPSYDVVLPVRWLTFIATKTNNTVKLYWEAEFGNNFDKFIVERNINGVWENLGVVLKNSLDEYNFEDMNPSIFNQYRIRAINFGESDTYSDVRIIRFNGVGPIRVSIFNVLGQLVGTTTLTNTNVNTYLNTLYLKSGVYFVKYENGQTEKVFIGYK